MSEEIDPPVTPPEPPAPVHDNGMGERMTRLEQIIEGLAQKVEALTPLPGDQTPTSTPWTHRKFN